MIYCIYRLITKLYIMANFDFRDALSKGIEVTQDQWISQALLGALQKDDTLKANFDTDFSGLKKESQIALLQLTQKVGDTPAFTERKRSNAFSFAWEDYTLVKHVELGEKIQLSEAEIDSILSNLTNRVENNTPDFIWPPEAPKSEMSLVKEEDEVKDVETQETPTGNILDTLDMNNLPEWEALKDAFLAIVSLDESVQDTDSFIIKQLTPQTDGDYTFQDIPYELGTEFSTSVEVQWSKENTDMIIEAYINEFHKIS